MRERSTAKKRAQPATDFCGFTDFFLVVFDLIGREDKKNAVAIASGTNPCKASQLSVVYD